MTEVQAIILGASIGFVGAIIGGLLGVFGALKIADRERLIKKSTWGQVLFFARTKSAEVKCKKQDLTPDFSATFPETVLYFAKGSNTPPI